METNHILIVEDDKEIREGIQIYLQSQGYDVFQAADGVEGLEIIEREEIYERVWQEKAINTDTIMVHVRNIREKIEIDPKNPKYLKVVWGVGYKIEKQA